ncbi:ROK family protein [Sphingomonas sp. MMS24-J13]|uniref:ROK family protein n=1 Tax=Sphingomonas sp. MMS24-J13 TaxID=3238686 RepID=UPI00384C2E7B
MTDEARYGCIEAGGTKFVCAIADGRGALLERARIPTTTPEATLAAVLAWFGRTEAAPAGYRGFGIASFGPVELDPSSPRWGSILDTPKPGWSGTPLARPIEAAFGVPAGFETDVNAAALAEAELDDIRAKGVVYITVGTGIGGGFASNGATIPGLRHAEMGHIFPPRHPDDTAFPGCCPFHGACLEGLASGPAIHARWGRSLSELPTDHPAHAIVAWYLGHLAGTLMAVLSPARIVFGGGVMHAPGLLAGVRAAATAFSAGYLIDAAAIADIIRAPRLGDDAGLRGALLLAQRAAR